MNVWTILEIVFKFFGLVCCQLASGAVWSYVMWARYVNQEIDFYEAVRINFMRKNNIRGDEIPEYLRFEWKKVIAETPRLKRVPPKSVDHRAEITCNVLFWEISFVWFVLVKMYDLLITRIEYNKIGSKRIEKIRTDLK